MAIEDYRALAGVFDYPDGDFPGKLALAVSVVASRYPTLLAGFESFSAPFAKLSQDAAQELFTRTFDVLAITTLDIGYVMFGDDYKRGELLANLNREHRQVGNDCGVELADHLPNLLRLLSMLGHTELVCELVEQIIGPSLRAMIREFDPKRIERKAVLYKKKYKTLIDPAPVEEDTIYLHALETLYAVLRADFDLARVDLVEQGRTSDFIKSVETEMELEIGRTKPQEPLYTIRGEGPRGLQGAT